MISINDQRVQDYLTPYHYQRPVMAGSGVSGNFDEKAVDIPFVFKHQGHYFLVYTGFDGIGYQSALARSDDLLNWNFYAMILERKPNSDRWDRSGGSVTWMIKESDDLQAVPTLKKIEHKYWLVYHSYPGRGYEDGAAEIGLAWCENEDLMEWHYQDRPIFSWRNGMEWEAGGLYKACIIEHEHKWYLFYNAKNKAKHWNEQIGMAVSEDLLHWQRHPDNPLLKNGENAWDKTFVADPYIVRDQGRWLCFYYGIGQMDEADGLYHAENGLAFSTDLIHWTKVDEPILKHGLAGTFHHHHAHKPAIFYEKGILYHFFCATCAASSLYPTELFGEYRTICVATSTPI
jgi:predicted GH43/DUF377 family glycosyl hydrolase